MRQSSSIYIFFRTKQIYTKKPNYKGKALNMKENEESKTIHIKNKHKGKYVFEDMHANKHKGQNEHMHANLLKKKTK